MNRPWPKLMKRGTAAAYCDLTPTKFLQEVAAGRLPSPVKVGGEDHWCRDQIDDDIARITGQTHDWTKDQPGLAA